MALNADWNGATAAAEEAIERPLGPPAVKKLTSWNLFRSMGSPRFIVAPMVDQSELAWRILSRLHGSSVAYTPMIHAALFANPQNSRYRKEQFDLHAGEEGHETLDRPVVAQFCANDPDTFLQAATRLAESGQVDAVDLNLGCPQGIAKRGQYGAFLMEDWGLIERMISHLHKNLAVPITAKFRVYDDLDKTLAYAKMLEGAGAQILTLHGRTRDQKGQLTGLADWNKIRKVKEAVSVPLFANGNILTHEDVSRCLEETKADGIMSAEGNLYNPALFEPLNRSQAQTFRSQLPAKLLAALDTIDNRFKVDRATVAYYPIVQLSLEYLIIVAGLETETALSAVKAHLFRMWKPVFNAAHHIDVRDALSRISSLSDGTEEFKEVIAKYVELTEELGRKLEADFASGQLTTDPKVALPETQDSRSIPYSHCQPCMRPLSETEAASVNLKKRGLDAVQHEGVALGDGNETVKKAKTELPPGVQLLPQTVQCPQCKGSAAAQKCVRRVCRVCCTLATQNDADAEPCEAHLGKERKEAAKAEARKQAKEAKKARAQKQKADALVKKEAKRQKGLQSLVAGNLNDGDKVEAASAEGVASAA